MAQHRDIDLPNNVPLRINGGDLYLTEGSFFVPDGDITVSGNIQGKNMILVNQASTISHAVRADRTISAGTGLTGGGDLTANRSLSVSFSGNGSASTSARSDHNHSTTYLGISATAVDSSKLGGISANSYLRTDAGGSLYGGSYIVNTTSNASPFYITRTGTLSESVGFGVDDATFYLNYTNDEVGSNMQFTLTNTDTEGSTGVSANTGYVKFTQSKNAGTNIFVNNSLVWHSGNFVPSDYSLTTHGHSLASASANGFMSSSDFSKLGGIQASAINQTTADGRYFRLTGGTLTGQSQISTNVPDLLLLTRTSATPNVSVAYQNTLGGFYAGGRINSSGSSDMYFVIAPTNDLTSGKLYVNVATGEITVSGNQVWHAGSLNPNNYSLTTHNHDAVYLGINATATNANSLGGISASNYMRTDIVSTGNAEISFKNGIKFIPAGASTALSPIFTGGATYKSYINFNGAPSSNDPGFIMHETSSIASDTNKGVIHICPTDDNDNAADYVTIHGTNDPETIKLFTGGLIFTTDKVQANGGLFVGANAAWHAGNFVPTQYVKNDTAGQSVSGNFTIAGDGNLWVGATTGTSGDVMVRSGGVVKIQLDAQGDNKQTGVMSYIDGNGNAQFSGNVTVNKLLVNDAGVVPNLNSTYLNGLKESEFTKNASIVELAGKGVMVGLHTSQQTVPNMTVLVNGGIFYTDSGRRFEVADQSIALSASSATYGRYDIVYLRGSSAGASEGMLTVLTGTPAPSPVAPTIPSDGVPLAKIYVAQNIGSILQENIEDITLWRRWSYDASEDLLYALAPLVIDDNTSAITGYSVVNIAKPIRAMGWAASLEILAGQTQVVWQHDLGIDAYALTYSINVPNRHIYWSNKTESSVTINIDDALDFDILIDAVITAL
jgi:cytoskeletal protein CcmA (bactofilin family)